MGRRESQKARERQSFDCVYGNHQLADVVDHERPDFIARHFTESEWFGIEVTELYETETNARLDNLPDYRSQLLAGGGFLHRDDQGVLDVARVHLETKDGERVESDIPAIIQEVSHPGEHARLIAKRIVTKEPVALEAGTTLSHTNLIIHDKSHKFRQVKVEDFHRTLFVPEMRVALSETTYREVYFVGFIGGDEVYAPLKMLHLLAELFLFQGALIDGSREDLISTDAEFLNLFASYLNETVLPEVLVSLDEQGLRVIFGDASVRFGKDKSLTVSIYADLPAPANAKSPDEIWKSLLGEPFHEEMAKYRQTHAFSTNALHPVHRTDCRGGWHC